jgi:hypothetical protein
MSAGDDPNTIDFGEGDSADIDWDANDPRRQNDQFAPPTEPCECYCLHCNRVFMSDQIWFQRIIGDKYLKGFWCCPTPNCGGAGFTFDIFPTDPNHPANAGWAYSDDDEEVFVDDEEALIDLPDIQSAADATEWDPDEPMYNSMEQMDDDIEGEEWKYGLEPGDKLPEFDSLPHPGADDSLEDERRYDLPDERPRELDWTNREDRETLNEDDIPF